MTKNAGVEREPKHEEKRPDFKGRMKAAPNWTDMEAHDGPNNDGLRIDASKMPQGMAAQWVTDSVLGKPMSQHRSNFEKTGWTPVHGEDFDGQFDGMFMPKGEAGEIKKEGMVLMMRPKELSDAARVREAKNAKDAVRTQEHHLTGDSAVPSNRISKSYERLSIPED